MPDTFPRFASLLTHAVQEMPHIRSLIQQGVVLSNGLIASFPSKTFPNHYT